MWDRFGMNSFWVGRCTLSGAWPRLARCFLARVRFEPADAPCLDYIKVQYGFGGSKPRLFRGLLHLDRQYLLCKRLKEKPDERAFCISYSLL